MKDAYTANNIKRLWRSFVHACGYVEDALCVMQVDMVARLHADYEY